jgi:hypothetical protein
MFNLNKEGVRERDTLIPTYFSLIFSLLLRSSVILLCSILDFAHLHSFSPLVSLYNKGIKQT